jgi:3-dehydroquinate synthase
MLINHRNGSYEVKFERVDQALRALPSDLRIITDSNVSARYAEQLAAFEHVYVVTPGERSKSLETFGQLLSWLANTKASRKTTICAFGGGVIGDLGGYVAASYMRGVPFFQIPTTLLSQVDSSVGGKVGIDLPEGKNLVGAFYPPMAVSISVEMLASLPKREFDNGMAEVWKYGFIMDSELVDILASHVYHANDASLEVIVKRCIGLKSQVVQADEFEILGLRAILNFGHTVGHAIEFLTGYGNILHGEAISIGMVVEARLGEILGLTRIGVADQVAGYLASQSLPCSHSVLKDEDGLLKAMYGDKKAVEGSLAFSLLSDVGQCKLVKGVSEESVRAALRIS